MTARRRGFALLTVLWLVLLLSVTVTAGVRSSTLDIRTSENRILLTRARWAALGCGNLVRARFAAGGGMAQLDSVALGSVVWCSSQLFNADERVNPNFTDSTGLDRLLRDPVRVASVLDWMDVDDHPRDAGAEREWYRERGRPLPRNASIRNAAELGLVRGFSGVTIEELEAVFTARGDGRISANRAPAWALASLSILNPDEAERIVALRQGGLELAGADQVVDLGSIHLTLDEFALLTSRLSFAEGRPTLRLQGSVAAGDRTLRVQMVAEHQEQDEELIMTRLEIE